MPRSSPNPFDDPAFLLRDLEQLRARLAESEAENDQWQKKLAEVWAEVKRLQAIVAEVRKLEAVDHGVAWPDLCHALYELDRA